MRVLVTGHLGFVGSHLCGDLKALGHEILGIDLKEGNDLLSAPLPNADRVFHLAAQTNAQSNDAFADATINVTGTVRVLEKYKDKVVLASSSMVNYPVSPYALSKRACEEYAKLYGAAVVRFCNLYGLGGHSVVDKFREAEVLKIYGDGSQYRTYAHVSDACVAMMCAKPGTTTILPGADLTVLAFADLHSDKKRLLLPRYKLDIIEGRQKGRGDSWLPS